MSFFRRLAKAAEPLDLARLAREEFALMAKAYFAPIYGTILVLRQVARHVSDQ